MYVLYIFISNMWTKIIKPNIQSLEKTQKETIKGNL